MEDRLEYWRGRPISEMTREELLEALNQAALEIRATQNRSINQLERLRELRHTHS